MRILTLFFLLGIYLSLSGCYLGECGGYASADEHCELSEEQKTWVHLADTVQKFEFTYKIKPDSFIVETLDGINRYIYNPDLIQYHECDQSYYQSAKNGLRIYKNDSTYLIAAFEENCLSGLDRGTEDGKAYDSWLVKGIWYKNVIFKKGNNYFDSLWYAKGIGFVKIKSKDRLYEMLPE